MDTLPEMTTFSTIFLEDYFENTTENITETTVSVQTSPSFNISGILLPIILASLVIFANFLSLLAFCMEKRLRTYNNYFIINLTILDFIAGLLLIPRVFHTHLGYYPFSQDICKVLYAFEMGVLNASNLAVIVICADRHRATYDPINHFMSRNKRQAVIKNAITWLVSLAVWVFYTTVPEFIIDFDNGPHCLHWYSMYPSLNMIPFITSFYLPFVIIAVLYFRIASKIRTSFRGSEVERQFAKTDANKGRITAESSRNEMTPAVSSTTINTDLSSDMTDKDRKMKNVNNANIKNTRAKRESGTEMSKATRTLLFIAIAFVVSWLPQSIITLIYSINPVLVLTGLPRPGRLFFLWMTNLNSFLNPISYTLSQPLFRSTIINMFLCRRK